MAAIPAGLFDKNTAVTTFDRTFAGCSRLAAIPAGLFDRNTAAYYFGETFAGCTSLTAIPDGLFAYNSKTAATFDKTFYSCTNLTLNENIFIVPPTITVNNRFSSLNMSARFIDMFANGGSVISVGGTAPNLWEYAYSYLGRPTTTRCFADRPNLTNASSIPGAWK